MPLALTRDALARLFPRARPEIRDAIYDSQFNELPRFGINTSTRRLAYFLSQAGEESGGFTVFTENLNYTKKRAHEVWPTRFPATNSTEPLDPKQLAIKVYGGRMGNAPAPSEDGWTYRGRGPIQLTGRSNYKAIGLFLGIDLERNPDWVNDREHLMLVQAGYWAKNDLNRFADRSDFEGLTKAINGGLTNLAERKRWLNLVLAELGRPGSTVDSPAVPQSAPVAPVPPPPDVPAPAPPAPPAAPLTKGGWITMLLRWLFGLLSGRRA